jgi:hypothetical protein
MTKTTTTLTNAERQARYRANNKVIDVRLPAETADAITKLADQFDVSRQEVMYQLIQFARTNRDWGRFGLTGWEQVDRRTKAGRAKAAKTAKVEPEEAE